jgi:hypothetical protein
LDFFDSVKGLDFLGAFQSSKTTCYYQMFYYFVTGLLQAPLRYGFFSAKWQALKRAKPSASHGAGIPSLKTV